MPDRSSELPLAISTYQAAHDRRDTDAALACFAEHASVIDEDQSYVGTARIREWLDRAGSQFTYTRTLTGVDDMGEGDLIVHNRLEGDFPGGEVDLRYRFHLALDLIERLEIAP